MQKEACLVCNHTICVPEGRGRRMFTTGDKSLLLTTPIQDCQRYAAVAILGTLMGNTFVYQEKGRDFKDTIKTDAYDSKLWGRMRRG